MRHSALMSYVKITMHCEEYLVYFDCGNFACVISPSTESPGKHQVNACQNACLAKIHLRLFTVEYITNFDAFFF